MARHVNYRTDRTIPEAPSEPSSVHVQLQRAASASAQLPVIFGSLFSAPCYRSPNLRFASRRVRSAPAFLASWALYFPFVRGLYLVGQFLYGPAASDLTVSGVIRIVRRPQPSAFGLQQHNGRVVERDHVDGCGEVQQVIAID